MATMNSLQHTLNNSPAGQTVNVKSLMQQYSKRFEEILGAKAQGFIASVVNLVNSDTNLSRVEPKTVVMSAVVAATLDLPVDKNLGFAYIIPYGNRAQFQMGYKGFIQLAIRTGLYRTINATEIYEGELVSQNRLTGEVVIDQSKKLSETVIGYASYFKLMNGFEKTLLMTVEEVRAHGKKHSKNYNKPGSPWQTDFHSMALKTVLKRLLSHYGIMSVEMHRATEADQSVVLDAGVPQQPLTVDYIDAPVLDVESSFDGDDSALDPTQPAAEMREPGQEG